MTPEPCTALVIGAGPAGLMAADRLLSAGLPVLLVEGKPSPARKFLMAGKSGLNLTKDEDPRAFLAQFSDAADWLHPILARFGPQQVMDWARSLGQPVFTGSSGRVFPKSMKGSPLLRAWLANLGERRLELRTRWRWTALSDGRFSFDTPDGPRTLAPRVAVLALGGASWARLGSDGAWAPILAQQGVPLASFQPANVGFRVDWSPHMRPHFGAPLKSVVLIAGTQRIRAEAVISETGLEGGGLYAVSRALREGASLALDLFPDRTQAQLAQALAARPASESTTNRLRKALRLSGARLALVQECARPLPRDANTLSNLLKSLQIPLIGPNPMDQAISTAGGIRQVGLAEDLMLRALPGVFAAGEMLDWEAPTGGYLLTASMATGRWAGDGAARFLGHDPGQDQAVTA